MVEPRNILFFNRLVAATLLQLYESFPAKVTLDAAALSNSAFEGVEATVPELFDASMSMCLDTISFLNEEGFLRYTDGDRFFDESKIGNVRLTLKGLAILGKVPDQLDQSVESRSLGAQLKVAVDEGASKTVSEIVATVLAAAIGTGVRALTG